VTDVSDRAAEPGTERRARLLRNWRHVLRTSNPPPGRVDPVSRWLVLTRASVLPMTVTAAAIAGLLAAYNDESVRWVLFVLAAVGLVIAHVANNLMNDLFDLEVGADSDTYPRALYAPHPVLSGTISRRGLLTSAIVVNALDLAILVVLFVARGWPMIAFALGGFLLSVAYTAPPLRLKKHGLGEATVLVVWGPLMVGGTYYAATGRLPVGVVVASLPYALLCTAVLMGKHIDKIPWDFFDGTRTLPVLIGEHAARVLTQIMMLAFYALVALLVGVGTLPIAALVVALAIPKLVAVWGPFSQPKPDEPPAGFPIWPLWFAALAFVHTRRAGGLLILGLVVGVILGW
jgi:1,4-dihydroxy-2-naphthoate octaprenyltransferase